MARTLTKQDCRTLVSAIKPSQLGPGGREIYSRLFQEAFGIPLEMVTLLRKSRLSIAELEKKLKMSRRTIFRYLLAIEKSGCTLELDEKGYKITKLSRALAPAVK